MDARILVVDDEPEIADLVEVYLKSEGCTVFKCGTGTEALAVVRNQALDLAILDVMLPDGDGFSLLGQLRQQYTARELVGLLAHAAGLIPEPAPSPPKTCCPCSAGRRYRKRICSCGSEHSQNARTDWSGVIRK